MSPKEGIFYAGVMAGIILGVTLARLLQLPHLVGLLGGFVLGMGLGAVAERVYTQRRRAPGHRPRSSDVVDAPSIDRGEHDAYWIECPSSGCDWEGDYRYSPSCPRCGRKLSQ